MNVSSPLARGDVVLVRFPFTDLSGQKLRPALIVGEPRNEDIILAFVTSRPGSQEPRAEHTLEPTDPEFRVTGLKVSSVIRLSKLATLHRSLVHRRLGHIGPESAGAVARCLPYVLGL